MAFFYEVCNLADILYKISQKTIVIFLKIWYCNYSWNFSNISNAVFCRKSEKSNLRQFKGNQLFLGEYSNPF